MAQVLLQRCADERAHSLPAHNVIVGVLTTDADSQRLRKKPGGRFGLILRKDNAGISRDSDVSAKRHAVQGGDRLQACRSCSNLESRHVVVRVTIEAHAPHTVAPEAYGVTGVGLGSEVVDKHIVGENWQRPQSIG